MAVAEAVGGNALTVNSKDGVEYKKSVDAVNSPIVSMALLMMGALLVEKDSVDVGVALGKAVRDSAGKEAMLSSVARLNALSAGLSTLAEMLVESEAERVMRKTYTSTTCATPLGMRTFGNMTFA